MKTVLIYSGGLDSTVLLYSLLTQDDAVLALSFDYGQRHRPEIEYGRQMCNDLKVRHEIADLRSLRNLLYRSSQTSDTIAVPEGHYTEESMRATIVPNRNMIMLSIAAGWALSEGFDRIAYAAHSGDHAIYPDCREAFVKAMRLALNLADWNKVHLHAAFLAMSKADIVTMGASLGVPFAKTWSCYKGENIHCGVCGTCYERREAFALSGVNDPTYYRSSPEAKSL